LHKQGLKELLMAEEGFPGDETLGWENTYAIARALIRAHPGANLDEVSLRMIYDWTLALPAFTDDPELANDLILASIYQEWFEEENPV
jgi:FeS assembly protein IscX